MFENVYEMFDLSLIKFKKKKKQQYEERMTAFRDSYGHYFDEMNEYVNNAEDKEAAAKEVAAAFTDAIFNKVAKRGKVSSIASADNVMFMIYYVFPAILLTEGENATLICDRIRDEFAVKFRNPTMGYTSYQNLYDGFKEKIFGIL